MTKKGLLNGFSNKIVTFISVLDVFLFLRKFKVFFSSFCFSSNIPSTTNFHILLLLLLCRGLDWIGGWSGLWQESPSVASLPLSLFSGIVYVFCGFTKSCQSHKKKKLSLILMCRLCSDSESENLQRLFLPYDVICDRSVNAQKVDWLWDLYFSNLWGFLKCKRWLGDDLVVSMTFLNKLLLGLAQWHPSDCHEKFCHWQS